MPLDKTKLQLLAGLCLACALLIGGYAWWTTAPPMRNAALPPVSGRTQLQPGAAPLQATFLVRHTALDDSHGRLAVDAGTGAPGGRRATDLNCEVLHFAGNRGVCLHARRGAITTYSAILFDAQFQPTKSVPLSGIPSRTRVSPDGRYAAITVFVAGHAYGGTDFSTATEIIDAVSGAPAVANLEQMEVWSGEGRLTVPDFNFWGVTFANNPNRFYASLGTSGVVYLVEGDITAKRMTVLKEGVECPSLSPDNTRIAFKKRMPVSGLPKWRLYVLDLATMKETAVAEPRFIDEQVEWLDDGHLLYTQAAASAASPVVTDVWVVPADGTGQPALLMREAASPTVLHRKASTAATH